MDHMKVSAKFAVVALPVLEIIAIGL